MTKFELELQIRNIADFANLEPEQVENWLADKYKYFEEFQEEFKQLKPQKFELAGAIITNRSLKEYAEVLLEKVNIKYEAIKNIKYEAINEL